MGFAKRSLERTYVKLSDLAVDNFTCEADNCGCSGGPAFAIRTDGNGVQVPVCSASVDIDGQLCNICLEEIADGQPVPGHDGAPVDACRSCEAAFYA